MSPMPRIPPATSCMTDLIFVDTNVLVYARDAAHAEKQERAASWMSYLWRSRSGRLSFQVLQEFYVTVTAKLKPGMNLEMARSEMRTLMSWNPLAVGPTIVERAWAVQDRYQMSWWDALIVSAAQTANCRYLLTEDLQDGQDLSGVKVVNPFEHSSATLGS